MKRIKALRAYQLFTKFMQSKILSKRVMVLAGLAILLLCVEIALAFPQKTVQEGHVVLVRDNSYQEEVGIGLPVRITISGIDVNAQVEYLGLTSDGAMDIPQGPDDVAWFNLGPRPGEIGSAVIAGHTGWKNNTPAVFDNLHTLRTGDTIFVEDENGVMMAFVVREVRTYGKDEIAPEVFTSSDGKAHLNIITCTVDWNTEEETFSERIVVFTDRQ